MPNEKVAPRVNDFSQTWEYELLEDVELDVGGPPIVVPKYFSYDGASIPSLAWQVIYTPFDPIVMFPALVHDWLYTNHQVPKSDADRILSELLDGNGVPAAKREIIYRAVEFFGGAAWDNSDADVAYMKWLRQKLEADGIDVTKYHFPPGV